MRTSRAILVLLFLTCLFTVASAQEAPSRWRTGAQKPRPDAAVQPAEIVAATIKRLGVGTPVTGGRNSIGMVELNAAAPSNGVTVQLSSSDPAVVVPATVKIEPGSVEAVFPVQSIPVAAPTNVTVSAKAGSTAAPTTASVTVVPPTVSLISCKPQTISSGASTTCTVQLEGPVASSANALSIALTSSNTAVASVPSTIPVAPGERSTSFTVTTKPLAQSAASLISASYGGTSKGTNVHVLPVSLRDVRCRGDGGLASSCTLSPRVAGHPVSGMVRLTAPAPAGGVTVKLSDDPNYVNFSPATVEVPAGQDSAGFSIITVAVNASTTVTITAKASGTGETRQASLLIRAAQPKTFGLLRSEISGVPIGGTEVPGLIELDGPAARGGRTFDLSYRGTTDITGPAKVTVPENSARAGFLVTVGPCSTGPSCKVFAGLGSSTWWSDSLIVKP
jgi:hypothetical protein